MLNRLSTLTHVKFGFTKFNAWGRGHDFRPSPLVTRERGEDGGTSCDRRQAGEWIARDRCAYLSRRRRGPVDRSDPRGIDPHHPAAGTGAADIECRRRDRTLALPAGRPALCRHPGHHQRRPVQQSQGCDAARDAAPPGHRSPAPSSRWRCCARSATRRRRSCATRAISPRSRCRPSGSRMAWCGWRRSTPGSPRSAPAARPAGRRPSSRPISTS